MAALGMQMKRVRKDGGRRSAKKGIKVVYISSPVKVKTCASNFRALVQELTGKDSDAAYRLMDMDMDANYDGRMAAEDGGEMVVAPLQANNYPSSSATAHESSPTCSDSVFDDALYTDGSFLGMFASNNYFLQESSPLDVLTSFDAV
ncbi:hypothetical protein SLEP1_g5472 [Rubroshorea leprosula]|uniref:VQ domain-containing protein n=1 Tax=Rubroshorea leprosula TaxID=152421 RepID=A0AAV5HSB8_9ROSI|nr:hypothetical protein SLEP1_g5472 [Rubroshorea leprosula]